MRSSCVFAIAAASLTLAQVRDAGSSEIRKEWVVGEHSLSDPLRAGEIHDPSLVDYLERIENRISGAIGVKPLQIRVTRSLDRSANLLPNGILYLTIGMLARMDTESELAGILAHMMAHSQHACVLAASRIPSAASDGEKQATSDAVGFLKLARYDPLSVVEILSKLSYENPNWAKAIRSDDLLDLRAALESEAIPDGGYILNSSEFIGQHARIVAAAPSRRR